MPRREHRATRELLQIAGPGRESALVMLWNWLADQRGPSRLVDNLLLERGRAAGAGRQRFVERGQNARHVPCPDGYRDLVRGVVEAKGLVGEPWRACAHVVAHLTHLFRVADGSGSLRDGGEVLCSYGAD